VDCYEFGPEEEITPQWVVANIKWEADPSNNWKLPHETYMDRSGDCEDMALLMAWGFNERGIYPYILRIEDLSHLGYMEGPHLIVRADGRYYDSVTIAVWDEPPGKVLSTMGYYTGLGYAKRH
jgi:hypothetical protein